MLLAGCGGGERAAESDSGKVPPVRATVQKPQTKTIKRTINLPGQVEAWEWAPLLAKVTGYVTRVPVDIGSPVKGPVIEKGKETPGDVLVEIDVPELRQEWQQRKVEVTKARAVVQQAKAAVEVAEAALTSAGADVAEAESAVEQSQAQLDRWKSESKRVTELAGRGAVTQRVSDETTSQLQAAEAAVRQSQARVRSAEARKIEASAGITKAKADLSAAEASVQVADAQAEHARTVYDFRILRAPFPGVVTSRDVHPGHLVRSTYSEPLLVVSRVDKLRVRLEVPEADALLIHTKNKVVLRVPSLPGQAAEATVSRTGESLDPANRAMKVEIDVPNDGGRFKPGTYVQAEIEVATRPNVLTLPRTALMSQDKETSCFIVDKAGVIHRVAVQPGLQAGPDVEIVSGLKGDESVITANVTAFREGQTVEAVSK